MADTGFPAHNLPESEEVYRYRMVPRHRPQYRSAVDAVHLFGLPDGSPARFRTWRDGSDGAEKLFYHTDLELPGGKASERVVYRVDNGLLVTERISRQVHSSTGLIVREEHVDFREGPYHFPRDIYPEVYAPFLMRGNPAPPRARSFHSWICDRFVARIWYELRRAKVEVEVPAGKFQCSEILMYPDLNDWIPLGNVLMTLAKPLLPRYHAWLALDPPHPLIRFEGAYGPPGAPEVVVELLYKE